MERNWYAPHQAEGEESNLFFAEYDILITGRDAIGRVHRRSESAQETYTNVSVIRVFHLLHTRGHCTLVAVIILQDSWVQLVSEVKVIFLLFMYVKKKVLLLKQSIGNNLGQ